MNKNRDPRKKLPAAREREAAAQNALPPPRPDSPMYESWAATAKAYGFFKEPPSEAQRFADDMENPDPHERLARAVDELISVLDAMGRGDARSGGKAVKMQADSEKHEAIKTAIRRIGRGDLLEKPYHERAIAHVFSAFAAFRSIEGMPTAQAFVRRLRGRKPIQ